MRLLATIVILLSASSMTSALFWGLFDFKTKEVRTAVDTVNDYLADNEVSSDLESNKAATEKYIVDSEERTSEAGFDEDSLNIAKLVTLLHDDCEAANIETTREAVDTIRNYDPKICGGKAAMRRIGTLIHNCVRKLRLNCFKQFEQAWLENDSKINDHFIEIYQPQDLEGLDKALLLTTSANKTKREEIGMLQEATTRYFNLITLQDFKEMKSKSTEEFDENGSEAKKMEAEYLTREEKFKEKIEEDMARLEAQKRSRKGALEAFTLDKVLTLVNEQIYEPCENLIKQKESDSILKPVGELASIVKLTELVIEPIKDNKISTFLWAARYYDCKARLMLSPEEFAAKVHRKITESDE